MLLNATEDNNKIEPCLVHTFVELNHTNRFYIPYSYYILTDIKKKIVRQTRTF